MSIFKAKGYREERAVIIQKMRDMVKSAENEDRAFTAEEDQEWASLDTKQNTLLKKAELIEVEYQKGAKEAFRKHDRNNGNHQEWIDKFGNPVRVYKPEDRVADGYESEISPGAFLRAMITGPRNDIEKRTINNVTQGGGNTVPEPLARQIIDAVRAQSVVLSAPGTVTVTMDTETLTFARLATDVDMAWRDQSETISEAAPDFDGIQLKAKNLGGLVKISRELVADSYNADQALINAFIRKAAVLFDLGLLFGTGTKQPVGIANFPGIQSLDPAGDTHTVDDWSLLVKQASAIKQANFSPSAVIWHPRTGELYGNLQASDKQPLLKPPYIENLPMLETTSVPIDIVSGAANDTTQIISGDFSKLVVGIRLNVEIRVLQELYAETNDVGIVCLMRGDVVAEYENAFHVINGIPAPA